MADTDREFGQYKKSIERGGQQALARLKLQALFHPRTLMEQDAYSPYEEYDLIGQLRNLLAPADTSAFPPEVLSKNVFAAPTSAWPYYPKGVGVLGDYSDQGIRINEDPSEFQHSTKKTGRQYNQYRTLLHEAGHARGIPQAYRMLDYKNHLPFNKSLLDSLFSEEYADAVADSLLGRKLYEKKSRAEILKEE